MYTRLNGIVTLAVNKITLPELASLLRKEAGLPVIDRTTLDGYYSVSLPVPAIWLNKGTDSDPSGADLFKSVEKLGLHLEKGKAEIDSLIVEHVEKAPSGN